MHLVHNVTVKGPNQVEVSTAAGNLSVNKTTRNDTGLPVYPGATLRDTGVLENALSNNQQINWVADPTIELGGCILEAEGDGLDARLETQINRLRTTLLAARMNPIRQVS